MGVIRRTPTSRRDYQTIWDYVAEQGGEAAADGLLQSFDDTVRLLSDFPKGGQARPELRPRLRSMPVGNYLIFYRPLRGGMELIACCTGRKTFVGFSRDAGE